MSLSSQPRYRTIFNHSQKKPNLLSSRPSFPSDPSSGPALTASPLCWLTSEQVCGLNSNTQHSLLLYFSKTGNIHRTAIGKLPFLLASVSVVEEGSLQKVKVTATQLSEQQRDSKLCVVSLARTLSSDLELVGEQRELVLGKVCIFPPVGVSIWLNITLVETSFINNRRRRQSPNSSDTDDVSWIPLLLSYKRNLVSNHTTSVWSFLLALKD